MIVTSKTRYALLALKSMPQSEPVRGDVLALNSGVPLDFLQQIMRRLRIAGLVATSKGPGGGYALSRPLETITALDVARAVGDLKSTPIDGPLTGFFQRLYTANYDTLGSITVNAL